MHDFADYTYLGADTIVDTSHPGVTGNLDLSMGTVQNGYTASTSGAGSWTGFGRPAAWWTSTSTIMTPTATCFGSRTPVPAYGSGRILYLRRTQSPDEHAARHARRAGGDAAESAYRRSVFAQGWNLDGLGNWASSSTTSGATTTTQGRNTNTANEITSITGSGAATPDYDFAGNLLNDGTLSYTYDAWDRQVGVATSGGTPIASYSFDGLNRRITKTLANGATTDYYYNENGQVLEEQARNSGGALTLTTQYVWDVSYIDTPVAQIQIVPSGGTQTLYYTTDANHNVTGLVNLSGSVVERYIYSAYGQVTFCDGNWARLTTTPAGGNNGGVGLQNSGATSGVASNYGNQILYCGYRFDPETAVLATNSTGATGNYQDRAREYSAALGDFPSRDPMGYAAGDENLYRYVASRPTDAIDPSGLEDDGVPLPQDALGKLRWRNATYDNSAGSGIEIVTITGARVAAARADGSFPLLTDKEGQASLNNDKIYVIGVRYLGSLFYEPHNLGNVVYETDLTTGQVRRRRGRSLVLGEENQERRRGCWHHIPAAKVTMNDIARIYNESVLRIARMMKWLHDNPKAKDGPPNIGPSIGAQGAKSPGGAKLGVITRPTSSMLFDVATATFVGQGTALEVPTAQSGSGEPNPRRYLPGPSAGAQGKAVLAREAAARALNEWLNGLNTLSF